MNGIRKVGLGLAAAASIYGVSQYVGDDAPAAANEGTEAIPPPPKEPETPTESVLTIEQAREKVKEAATASCPMTEITAAEELVADISGESLHDRVTYTCLPDTVRFHGEPTIGLVDPGQDGSNPTISLMPNFQHLDPVQQATALFTLERCAEKGGCEGGAYQGPGKDTYPGGERGREAQEFYNRARKASREAARPPEKLTSGSVAEKEGKGTYEDAKGGVLEGNFNHGEVNGTYTLHGAKLTGSFTVEDGLVKPKGEINISFPDKSKLTCQFIDGKPNGTQSAIYTDPQGKVKNLLTYLDADQDSDWAFVVSKNDAGVAQRENYHLDDNFKLAITPNTYDPNAKE